MLHGALEDKYCTDGFFVEVMIPQALSGIMKDGKSDFLSPGYPYIIVSKLADDIIRAVIESFIDPHYEVYWLKLYHLTVKLNI